MQTIQKNVIPLELRLIKLYCAQAMRLVKYPTVNPIFFIIITFVFNLNIAQAAAKQTINIAYLTQELTPPAALSNLDPFVKDKGVIGAELGITDNNTTGDFT